MSGGAVATVSGGPVGPGNKKPRRDLPSIIKRYREGARIPQLSAEFGVSRRTIYNWILGDLGAEKYEALITEILVGRVADADEELENALVTKDREKINAAEKIAKYARMDLERRRPHLYGQKQEMRHTGPAVPSFTVVLLDRPSSGGAVVDVTPVAVLEAPGKEEEKETR